MIGKFEGNWNDYLLAKLIICELLLTNFSLILSCCDVLLEPLSAKSSQMSPSGSLLGFGALQYLLECLQYSLYNNNVWFVFKVILKIFPNNL